MIKKAYAAAGCFWGVQSLFKKLPGIVETQAGYMGGEKANPSYQEVSSGLTGHAECIAATYDEEVLSFEGLLRYFFEIHDFEQTDGQGPDKGPQYQSIVFFNNPQEKAIAEELLRQLSDLGYKPATLIKPAGPFYAAEEMHQDYYDKTKSQPYCHIYKKIWQ